MAQTADYVVVGAGSAGCVIANRLSENPANRVTLLEAGNSGPRFWITMPAGMRFLMGDPRADWLYKTEPDPSINNRITGWPRGKALGGSSAINGLVYIRGDRGDYDAWANAGCTGWSFDELLPYFKKSECFEGDAPPGQSHGLDGPFSVSNLRSPHPLGAVFRQACLENQILPLEDYCGGDQTGSFMTLTNQRQGRRCTTADSFLDPVRSRSNLTIVTNCTVDSVLFDGKRAMGVHCRQGTEAFDIRANAEVIISAGTLASPTLLMRSGVGPGPALQSFGIDVVSDLSGVGKNLQEHSLTYGGREVNVPTFNTQAKPYHLAMHLANYLLFGRGLLTSAATTAMANARTLPELDQPDVTLHFTPIAFDSKPGTLPAAGKMPPMYPRPAIRIAVSLTRPFSRGEIRLRGSGHDDTPIIDHRLLGDERDVAALIRGCKLVDKILESQAFRPYIAGKLAPLFPNEESGWEEYIRKTAAIGYHPVGTCRMGIGSDAVVDPQLRVRGTVGLRVADAAIMPALVSANTNAAAIMIGEKAADFILHQ